jgi:hypothetical protein
LRLLSTFNQQQHRTNACSALHDYQIIPSGIQKQRLAYFSSISEDFLCGLFAGDLGGATILASLGVKEMMFRYAC